MGENNEVSVEVNREDSRSNPSKMSEAYEELMYAFNSFLAVFWPVSITIILAALCIVYINDGTNGNGAGGIATLPTVRDESAATTTGETVSAALLNALVMIGVITGITFAMVLLYWLNCMIVFVAWLVLSTAMLLGFTTQYMVWFAMKEYDFPWDQISFYFFWYNFAICGVISIFYQKFIPPLFTQTYLVVVSVVMSWMLTKFLPEWTAWALLVLLAFYDLCAVLTPCGPLKCLLEVSAGAPTALPGLLYEAQIREHHIEDEERSQSTGSRNSSSNNNNGGGAVAGAGPFAFVIFMADGGPRKSKRASKHTSFSSNVSTTSSGLKVEEEEDEKLLSKENEYGGDKNEYKDLDELDRSLDAEVELEKQNSTSNAAGSSSMVEEEIAREPAPTNQEQEQSLEEQRRRQAALQHQMEHEMEMERNSIKLGLGDFVFYSVLAGKAALFGFSTFVAVFVTILGGLASTLFLLAVFHKALPALPISICFGVAFYFLTEMFVTPMVNSLAYSNLVF